MDLQTAQHILSNPDAAGADQAAALAFLACSAVAALHRIGNALDRALPEQSGIIGVPRQ